MPDNSMDVAYQNFIKKLLPTDPLNGVNVDMSKYSQPEVENVPRGTNTIDEQLNAAKKQYLETVVKPIKQPEYGLGNIASMAKENAGPKKSILGGILGGIGGLISYAGSSQGLPVLGAIASANGSPYMAQGALGAAQTQAGIEKANKENAAKMEEGRQKQLGEMFKQTYTPFGQGIVPEGMEIAGYTAGGKPYLKKIGGDDKIYTVDSSGNLSEAGSVAHGSKVFKTPLTAEEITERSMAGIPAAAERAAAIESAKQKAQEGRLNTADAGRYVLAKTAVDDIESAKNILFPTGKPESFRRDIAALSDLPLIGAAPFNEDAQKVFSFLKTAVAAKILAQTGVAARPEEVELQVKSYLADWKSNPDAALENLNRLQDFNREYSDSILSRKPSAPKPKKELPKKESNKDPLGLGI